MDEKNRLVSRLQLDHLSGQVMSAASSQYQEVDSIIHSQLTTLSKIIKSAAEDNLKALGAGVGGAAEPTADPDVQLRAATDRLAGGNLPVWKQIQLRGGWTEEQCAKLLIFLNESTKKANAAARSARSDRQSEQAALPRILLST